MSQGEGKPALEQVGSHWKERLSSELAGVKSDLQRYEDKLKSHQVGTPVKITTQRPLRNAPFVTTIVEDVNKEGDTPRFLVYSDERLTVIAGPDDSMGYVPDYDAAAIQDLRESDRFAAKQVYMETDFQVTTANPEQVNPLLVNRALTMRRLREINEDLEILDANKRVKISTNRPIRNTSILTVDKDQHQKLYVFNDSSSDMPANSEGFDGFVTAESAVALLEEHQSLLGRSITLYTEEDRTN